MKRQLSKLVITFSPRALQPRLNVGDIYVLCKTFITIDNSFYKIIKKLLITINTCFTYRCLQKHHSGPTSSQNIQFGANKTSPDILSKAHISFRFMYSYLYLQKNHHQRSVHEKGTEPSYHLSLSPANIGFMCLELSAHWARRDT